MHGHEAGARFMAAGPFSVATATLPKLISSTELRLIVALTLIISFRKKLLSIVHTCVLN